MKKVCFILIVAITSIGSNYAAELPEPIEKTDYYDDGTPNELKVNLGNLLFFDKILSGNKNISCGTCHSPFMSGGDGLSLGVGEGGEHLGPMRTLGAGEQAIASRVARNAPSLWNVGAAEFTKLNWQGVHSYNAERDQLELPSGPATPDGLDNVLAGQALFPVTNVTEMLGQLGDNDIIDASIGFPRGTPFLFPPQWDAIAARLQQIPEYVSLFIDAFSEIDNAEDITFVHAANAIAAFETHAFRSNQSPFDRYLNGERQALTVKQRRGLDLFYDRVNGIGAGCWSCHSGPFQTDHNFHAIAVPQFGPGVLPAPEYQDYGREEVTRDPADRFKFRTPSLRNVSITFPYGHNGAFGSLEAMIKHHLSPVDSLNNWDKSQVTMKVSDEFNDVDFEGYDDLTLREELADANELNPVQLSQSEIDDLIEFLNALTDPTVLNMHWVIPSEVPSGLPVGD
ncbi:cytochrome c peroxidase [uncultured Paraglaciecola sp.]|uniref:cytochrome-c peroxidase n=1 Tax=uncultured Paraglaciecola sp. TaxID=1765024 RepID=UPI002593A45D|nr:cytochrome c peroxidase [uncultured Paraglaciecola sp.]